MDESCLAHRLSDGERKQFEDEGYLVVPGVLPADKVNRLAAAAECLDAEWRPKREAKPHHPLNILDAIGMDAEFLDLLELPQTFMKVVDILGWNIQLYHSHLIITPPLPRDHVSRRPRLGWHQDSGRLNLELEGEPRSAGVPQSGLLLHQHDGNRLRQLPRRAGQPPSEPARPARGRPTGSPGCDAGARRCRRRGVLRQTPLAFGRLQPLGCDPQGAVPRLQLPLAAGPGRTT